MTLNQSWGYNARDNHFKSPEQVIHALLGAADLIRRCHPVIVSEFSPNLIPLISGVPGTQYLQLLIDFGYRVSVLAPDGRVQAFGTDTGLVMQAWQRSGVDHIDLLFEPG